MSDELKMVIRPELATRPEYRALAEAATPVVAEAIGKTAPRVTMEWGLANDERGRTLVTLELHDWNESAIARFAPDELQPPDKSWRRFNHLWRDVLEKASETNMKLLKASLAEDD